MPRVGFEHTIPAFERAKAVRALDRAATVAGDYSLKSALNQSVHLCLLTDYQSSSVVGNTMYFLHEIKN
jgi:hypothetical protein